MYYLEKHFSFREKLFIYIGIIYLLFFKKELIKDSDRVTANRDGLNMTDESLP